MLVPFPFSDLSRAKLRPAIVLAAAGHDDWILCQVTSNPYGDRRAVRLSRHDLREGTLRRESFARPGRLFTANRGLMTREIGRLTSDKLRAIVAAIVDLLERGLT